MSLGLLGAYDSDDSGSDGPGAPAVPAFSKAAPPPAPPQRSPPGATGSKSLPERPQTVAPIAVAAVSVGLPAVGPGGRHGAACDCEDCESLVARFVAKNLQAKGIRFKCKLCSELVARKADAAEHIQISHSTGLQAFKQVKQPKLFEATTKVVTTAAAKKISFAREDVLGRKRKMDDEKVGFGGWAKKEKPEPPPCEMEGYQDGREDVIGIAPWVGQPVPLSNDTEATDTERQVDQHVVNAQAKRFTSRNVLEVKRDVIRCKLCYKTFDTLGKTEKHIIEDHRDDFDKELKIWHRFLHTYSKRQPPFGWVCKICNIFFPTDNSTWRHIGKEVFIRREEKHKAQWTEKEDRWGHEEDGECCGDGMNSAGGQSFETIQQITDATKKEEERERRALEGEGRPGDEAASSSEESESTHGVEKKIKEF